MRLSRRLLWLIVLCLLPMVAAGVATLAGLYVQRRGEFDALATRQAELANADVRSVVGGARALLLAVAQIQVGPDCPERLAALQRELSAYRFLAMLDGAGRVVCASRPDLATALAGRPIWLARLMAGPAPGQGGTADISAAGGAASRATGTGAGAPGGTTGGTRPNGFSAGTYATLPGIQGAFLPLAIRPRGATGGDRLLLAALDLRWLGQHLSAQRALGGELAAKSALTVIDREGVVLARVPEPEGWVGSRLSPDAMARIKAPAAGVATMYAFDEHPVLLAASPVTRPPDGLFVVVGVDPPGLLAEIGASVVRAAVLGGLATLAALVITYLAARRFIQHPAGHLLAAAQRWRRGDLATRADMHGDRSEFGRLGEAFNQMASDLETRVAEHAQQAHLLEALVAERAQELSDSNNRLQVEIAERQRTEAVLHQAQKLQAVGRLAGGVAHDFNNLLATILGSLELIERRVEGEDERLRKLLARAMDAVHRGAQLTSRLLAFSRRQRLAAQPTDLNRLVADLVTLAGSTLGRRVRIETELAPDLWPALADPSQVEAAILNLALNARDAMPEGGVLRLATGNETVTDPDGDAEPGDYVRISVSDTGIGMSNEVLARAFEPFFTTKELGKSSGLGLSQVYGLARQSGGTVRIRSVVGGGTTVALLLPRVAQTALAADGHDAAGERRHGRAELVLLVDDDAGVRQVSVEMLRDLGYEVAEAAGGEEALDTVRQLPAPPALLVLDYAMPGMNGLRLAAALRAMGIEAPLLLATGYAELSDDESGVTPDAILHKPFSLAELDRTLLRLRTRTTEVA
ncbi:MAG TPA: ATP-binding protein [Acetobacteraceae bacterium]|nr:ATP-binding protein [Acetobacteraceae bacterium]